MKNTRVEYGFTDKISNKQLLNQFLGNIVKHRFEWNVVKNTTTSNLDFEYAERIIFEDGKVGVYPLGEKGLTFFRILDSANSFDEYGIPKTFKLASWNSVELFEVNKDDPEFYIISDFANIYANDFYNVPNFISVKNFASKLAKIDEVKESRLNSARTPFIFKTKKESLRNFEKLLKNYTEKNAIFVDETFGDDGVKILDLKLDLKLSELEKEYEEIFQNFSRFFGFSSQGIEKSRELIVAETVVGDDISDSIISYAYKSRKNFVEFCKEKGVEIELKKLTMTTSALRNDAIENNKDKETQE